jgi:hypothetical protein
MNTKSLIAAAALALIGSAAFAQTAESEAELFKASPVSTLSRADVRAEFLRARADHQLPVNSDVAQVFAPVQASNVTRAEVRAELLKARAAGLTDVQPLDITMARSPAQGRAASVQAGY